MSEALTMSKKERTRAHFYRLLANGTMTVSEVSEHLAISERQCYRMKARYRARGDAGLIHTLRGRPSNRGYKKGDRTRVIELYQKRYEDYGPTLFAERVEEAVETVLNPDHLPATGDAGALHDPANDGIKPGTVTTAGKNGDPSVCSHGNLPQQMIAYVTRPDRPG